MNWRRFFRRGETDAEERQELESYLEITTEEYVAQGMDPAEARQAAMRKLGNTTRIREEIYTMNTVQMFDTAWRHTRFTLRSLRQNPTFAIAAILTLAIGIGANTAVFSVVNSILLKPLPYPDADRLIDLHQEAPGAGALVSGGSGINLSRSMYFTYARQNRSFEAMGVWQAGMDSVTGLGEPEQVRLISVSEGTLEALKIRTEVGRLFSSSDQVPGAALTVVLSYGYWQKRFGGDAAAVGRKVFIGGKPHEIIGVAPANFRMVDAPAELILPMQLDPLRQQLAGFNLRAIARLKPGVTIGQANADVARLVPIWMLSWPDFVGGALGDPRSTKVFGDWRITPAFRPLKATVVGNIGSVLWVVMGTLGIVMLIACANVANLLLVRVEARQQELAVRAALGAGWARIVSELLLESALLAIAGAALGIEIAYGGLRLLTRIGPANLPRLNEISLDGRALLFAVVLSALAAILFGLIPALKYAGPKIPLTLRGGRGAGVSRERHRARNLLVVTQVALALVLLIGSGLMIRTFQELRRVDPGFTRPEQVETLRILIPPVLVPEAERVGRLENEIADKLAAIPGVTSVGFASSIPMDQSHLNWDGILKEGQSYAAGDRPAMRTYINVSPGFFRSLGTRVAAGRDFTWNDLYKLRPVVMVSENLAKELWGSAAGAIGRRVRPIDISPWFEVIGVVQDVRSVSAQEAAPTTVYWPTLGPTEFPQWPVDATRAVAYSIRSSSAGTPAFLEQVRQAVWSANASLPVAEMQTLDDIVGHSMARTSFTLVMLAIAGGMALILGVIGIYGVIAYTVAQRRREVGIRMALGAEAGDVQRMFVGQGLSLCAFGVVAGMVGAAGLSRLMSSLLFGVAPFDPVTFVATPALLFVAAAAACYIPARRAAAVDPAETLRSE
jgi:predicted permease